MDNLITRFQNPPHEYREIPFWSWNDELDPKELVRQIGLIEEAGWGGFFMHARVGLRTPYLGEDWMTCVRACVQAARERGMGAWLYDEDKWPSGFAGGLSVAAHPEFRMQYLVCKVDDRPALLAERIATFVAKQVSGQLTDVRCDDAPTLTGSANRVIQFYPQTMPLGLPKFNDYAYLSLINADAVRAFLDSTHEVYARDLTEMFGSVVPGIFTDEPCYLFEPILKQPAIPWTDNILEYFQARNGYDLLPHLPSLFFDVGDYQPVRYDFWRTVTRRYVENYTRQVYDWCDVHHLQFTGHQMAEDKLLSQIRWIGAAMPHYAYMHIPGVDKLGRSINIGDGTPLTLKQLDSVACQLGKPRTLCENYGCGGQDFSHAGRKWIGDWAYALGINLNNPHLSLYSMRGERKRDYPQNLFYQQPWWQDNRLVADYFARLSYILSQGQRVADILVIHPMGSAWASYTPTSPHGVNELDRVLDRLLTTLLCAQRDFHLGDETLMEPDGPCAARVVTDGDGARLWLGQMGYRVVIVPPDITLSGNTVRLLHEFAQAGGSVLAMEPVPNRIDGRATNQAVLPPQTRRVTFETLLDTLDQRLPFDVRVPGCPSIWYHHRRIDQTDCYFFANTDLDQGSIATVQLRGAGKLEEWDAATGEVRLVASRERNGLIETVLDFAPAGSHLLLLHRNQAPVVVTSPPERVVAEIPFDGNWQLTLHGFNSLTLDTPQIKIGDEGWSQPMHVLDAHDVAKGSGVGSPFALRFMFDAAERPADPIYLVVESPERFEIALNGQSVPSIDAGWWVDISFRKVDISAAVRAGRNEIILRGVFARDTELESIYVIGHFGVTGRRLREENRHNGQVFDRYASDWLITAAPEWIASDKRMLDLTSQGFPFFAGRVTLCQSVTLAEFNGRAMIELRQLRAAVARVRVNGQDLGAVAWQPHCLDVTVGLHAGANVVEIELAGTLRNLLGPHHLKDGDLNRTGPQEFRDKSRWTEDTILMPFGFAGVTLKIIEADPFSSERN